MKELSAIVARLCAPSSNGGVLATLVSVAGSSYRRPGARLLLEPDGTRTGSISGGCLEEDVLARAAVVQRTGQPDAVVYDTTSENDLVWGVGLGCHGVVRVMLEKLPPQPAWANALARNAAARRNTAVAVRHAGDVEPWGTRLTAPGDCPDPDALFVQTVPPPTALYIFGAGDDAQPLVRVAKELGWVVSVADPRPAFATAERFPTADRLIVGPPDLLLRETQPDASSLAVVMTHHYVHDVPLLRGLLARPLAYLGLLGPRKRAEKILADLAQQAPPPPAENVARLHAPIGLDLGADAPEQVALSMVAEMQACLNGRDARPLRERSRPIHG